MLEHLIDYLGSDEDFSLTGEEIADILWLTAQRWEFSETLTILKQESSDPSQPTPSQPPDQSSHSQSSPQQEPSAKIEPISTQTQTKTAKSLPIALPDAPSLPRPLNLVRSLRLLLGQIESGEKDILDEVATANQTAQTTIDPKKLLVNPVLKARSELQFDLALVIEESTAIGIWQHILLELKRLLEHYGIFRDVRTWHLVERTGEIVLHQGLTFNSTSSKNINPNQLIDPSGRRLIWVVSDCTSALWYSGKILPLLQKWSKSSPVAILQLLPPWLWQRSALRQGAFVSFASNKVGILNPELKITELLIWKDIEFKTGIKLPVFTLNPSNVEEYSSVIAGKNQASISGFIFPASSKKSTSLSHQAATYETFRLTASPLARKLAALLAAAPIITLPIVRILQEHVLRESDAVHVAEVFLGGLLKPLSTDKTNLHPDQVQYQFINEEAQKTFLKLSPISETVEVINIISRRIAQKIGIYSQGAFQALLKNPKQVSTEDFPLIQHFAEMTVTVLQELGGDYAQFAQELAQQWVIQVQSDRNIDYSHLQELLSAQKWREADEETAKLMLQAANRQQEGWLRKEDVEAFPSNDLQTLDRLWIHYSQGHFSFSVQKKIYQELGGTRKYDVGVWRQFGDVVGWRINKEWVSSNQLTFALSAPQGHLPIGAAMSEKQLFGYRRILYDRLSIDDVDNPASESDITQLIQDLQDESYEVRMKAAEALGQIGSVEAVAPLIHCLQDADLQVREKAAEALGKIGTEIVVEPLIRCLQDSSYQVREKAIEALRNFPSQKVLDRLKITATQDAVNVVRQKAQEAIAVIESSLKIPRGMKPKSAVKIFLAHAHEDQVRVIELYNKLKREGYSPWLDRIDLLPGQQWKNEIPKALKKSDILIACLSETSIKKQGYIQNEFRLALRQAAEMPADAIYLIPLKFDECRIPELEQVDYGIQLRDFQWLDYWEAGAFERLVAAIEYRRGELEVLEKEERQEKKSAIAQQYREVEKQDETESFQKVTALEIWRKRLAYFQEQKAIIANAADKFQLEQRIKECQEKIEELENEAITKIEQSNRASSEKSGKEAKLRQYRKQVQVYLEDHRLSKVEEVLLEQKRKKLGITEAEASQILAEEQEPIFQAREEYQELLEELIEAGCYPFDEEIQRELETIKQEKQLKEWEITEIEQSILRKAEKQASILKVREEYEKLLAEEAITADPSQKFALSRQIEECERRIRELEAPQNSRSVLEMWRELLDYLHRVLAITADPSQKFELSRQIEECERRIRELEAPQNSRSVLEMWRELLDYLHRVLAITADPSQKFELSRQIEECQQEIMNLNLEFGEAL